MSEMRLQSLTMTGRIEGSLIPRGAEVFFRVRSTDVFECVAVEKAAENLAKYCQDGDEIIIEGKLVKRVFMGNPMTLVEVKYVSFGRKQRSLRV